MAKSDKNEFSQERELEYATPLCVEISKLVSETLKNAPKKDKELVLFVSGRALGILWIRYMRMIGIGPDIAFGMLRQMWTNMEQADLDEATGRTIQ